MPKSSLPTCPYGAKCYRSNPQHKSEFQHDVPDCPFGKSCYRQNPSHLKEFRHDSSLSVFAADEATPKRCRRFDGTPEPALKFLKKNQELDFFASDCRFSSLGGQNSKPDNDGEHDIVDSDEYEYAATGQSAAELTAELLKGDCRYPAYTVHFDRKFALDQVFPLLSHSELVVMALVSSNWFRFIHRGASELWKSLYERKFGRCRSLSAQDVSAFFLAQARLWMCGKHDVAQLERSTTLPFLTHHPIDENVDWRKQFVWRSGLQLIETLLQTVGAHGSVFYLQTPAERTCDLADLRQYLQKWFKAGVVIKLASLDILCEDLQRASLTGTVKASTLELHLDRGLIVQFRAEFSRSVGYIGLTKVAGALFGIVLSPLST